MKMKLICIFLFGCAAPLLGQQPAPAPTMAPLPPGPLLKRTPDYSTWTITSKGTPLGGAAPAANGTAGGGQGQQQGAPVTQLTVVKTGFTKLEYYIDANGQRHEIWHIAGLRIVVRLGAAGPLIIPESAAKTALVCPDYGGGDIYSINFAASDFAGLDWLSPSTYAGMVEYQGNDCIVFKGSVSPLGQMAQAEEQSYIAGNRAIGRSVPDAVRVPAVAYVDLASRLPVFVQFGGEKCTFQYGPTPRAPLQLPAQLEGPATDYEHRIEALSAPASRPF